MAPGLKDPAPPVHLPRPVHVGERQVSADPAPGELTWRAHPARERIGAALLTLTAVAALSGLAALMMQSVWWGLLAAVMLLVPLRSFFLPSRYRLDEHGIAVHRCGMVRRFRWKDVRRLLFDSRGAFLSRRSRATALDPYRGMHVLFSGNRQQVVACIRDYVRAKEAGS